MNRSILVLLACGAGAAFGCGGTPDTARQNVVFYDLAMAGGGAGQASALLEKPYPPLSLPAMEPLPGYSGVSVLREGVRLSRPNNWIIREAKTEPGNSYIQYISPKAYSFALYERPESPQELWREVLGHYEDDVGQVGATIKGKRVATGAFRGQGRAYTLERKVEAAKRPLIGHSREILMRGEHRVVLVQILHEGDDLSGIDQELMRVLTTLEVL